MTHDAKKFYELRRPCDNCPFRTDVEPYLRQDRAREIVDHLARGSFSCHKTVDHEDSDDDDEESGCRVPGPEERQCAGALIMMAKAEVMGQMGRIAMRLGVFDPDKLDMEAPVFASPEAFIQAQENHKETYDPCSVCGPNCEAPAGTMGAMGAVSEPNYTELPCCYGCGDYVCEACSQENPEDSSTVLCTFCLEEDDG